jgi:CyaY protein
MDDQEFAVKADEALADLHKRLLRAAEQRDFEADLNNGALAIEFEEPRAKFVVSPNSPVKQIWVSAHAKSFKLDWDAARNSFVHAESGRSLAELIGAAIGEQLGEEIAL